MANNETGLNSSGNFSIFHSEEDRREIDALVEEAQRERADALFGEPSFSEESKMQDNQAVQEKESQLFELASSAKYLANDNSAQDTGVKAAFAEATIRKGLHPNENTIEKDGKTLQFDQDMNVVKNDFSAKEIKELSQNLKKDKEQKMEQNRTKEINRNIGLSI